MGKTTGRQLIAYSLMLLMASLPFLMVLAPIVMVLFVVMVLLYGNWEETKSRLTGNKVFPLFFIYYLIGVIGLFYSYELGFKYSRIASQLPLLLLPLFVSIANVEKEQIKKAKYVFVWSCLLLCILAFVTLGYNLALNYEHRLNYNFIQRSMYHFHYPYDVLYINIAYVFLLSEEKLKTFRGWMGAVFFIFILLSGVRMGVFTFGVISTIYFIKNFREICNLRFVAKAIILGIIAVLMIGSSKYAKDKFFDTLSNFGLGTEKYVSEIGSDYHKMSLRTMLWSSSFELIKSKPILGFGPNGSQKFLEEQYQRNGYSNLEGFNSHNQFLTTTLNHGVVGLFSLLSIFIVLAYHAIKKKNWQQLLCIVVLFLAFNTESILVRQKGVFVFAIILSLNMVEKDSRSLRKKEA